MTIHRQGQVTNPTTTHTNFYNVIRIWSYPCYLTNLLVQANHAFQTNFLALKKLLALKKALSILYKTRNSIMKINFLFLKYILVNAWQA